MEESIDPAASSLLCMENKNMCFEDFGCNAAIGSGIFPSWDHKNLNFDKDSHHGSERIVGFLVLSDETVVLMVEREKEHLPKDDYLKKLRSGDLDLSVRKEALDWIWKAHNYYGFAPWSFLLSVNYLDRFLSLYEFPRGKSWTAQLLAVACLSIAAKIGETKVPRPVNLQAGEPEFEFEAKSIQRMELLVLSTLRWKMQALIPYSFIDYFLSKVTCEQHLAKSSISKSVDLMLSIIRCIDFLEFRPSEIAAAVAISVTREFKAKEIDKALTCFVAVEKERVYKCLELIRDLSLIKVSATSGSNLASSVPQSPVGVLDDALLSSKSDELTVGSCTNSSHDIPNAKRKKPNGPSDGDFKSCNVNFPPSSKFI